MAYAEPAVAGPGDAATKGAAAGAGWEERQIAGWNVHVSRKLLAVDPQSTAEALELLKGQLEKIEQVVPAAAVAELKKVPLWISPEYPGIGARAEYHPEVGWLRENGRDPVMARGVEFTNVRIFAEDCRRMPVLVLHELAHAYHDRVLGNDNAQIVAAYEKAKTGGKYDQVERRDAQGKTSQDRAYALTNPQEYFAETTEAFFGVNDFYPYTRDELQKQDPGMCELLGKLWGVEGAKPGAEK